MNSDHEETQKRTDSETKVADESTENQEAGKAEHKDDGIVRVSRTASIRAQIGYAMKRVKLGESVTIQGLGMGISRAITIASIVRDRVGNVHMLNSFSEVEDKKRPD